MDTIIVHTKVELEEAKSKGCEKIIVKGELADKLYKSKKITTLSKTSLALIVGAIGTGIAFAPFSGGTSLAISGITAATVGVTTGLGTATILAISFLGTSLLLAIYKEYDIKAKVSLPDGTVVEVELTKKS